MKKKIFLYYVVLVVIGITITGFFISKLAETLYKQEVEKRLTSTAFLIENEIADDINKGITVDYDQAAKKFSQILNYSTHNVNPAIAGDHRVTFINFQGKVIGESEANYQTMENHLGRKEVQQALKGQTGEDIRRSHTLDIDLLYIAVPIKNAQAIARLSVPLVELNNINHLIWAYTITGIIVGLLLTALLALRFSSSITKPINELITVSEEISMGNYSKRAKVESKDELGHLADTFNQMAYRLEHTVADLIDKNVKVETMMNSIINGIVAVDNSYRLVLINAKAREMFGVNGDEDVLGRNIIEVIRNNQINSFIRDAVDRNISMTNEVMVGPPEDRIFRVYTNPIKPTGASAPNSGAIAFVQDVTNIRKLEQIRTEFVSNVTHELKTPLTSIRGFVETLRAGAVKDSEVADKFLEIIDIESERLYTLINDILQLSEIETKQKDSNIHPHNLTALIDEVISILQGVAAKKNIAVINETKEDITLSANRDRIKQMLINLVDNGIKYNVQNGSVVIKAYKAEGKIVISVKDTGIGIAKDHLPRIFERFYRVDKGRSRNQGGTGLGLSIVKHIVNLYNGDIRVISEPSVGTEFIIKLPV